MPRNNYRKYSQQQVDEAFDRVRLDKMSVRKAAELYGIPKSTLIDKVNGKTPMKSTQGPSPYLSLEEEAKLSNWAQQMARMGFGVNRLQLQQTVQKIVAEDHRQTPFKDGMPGQKWLKGFFRRHPELSERKPELLGGERAVVTTEKFDKFYEDVHAYLESKGCSSILTSPRRIFNCDETGFPLCGKMSRVISTKGSRTVSSVGSSSKSHVTVLATIAASGDVLPPTIVLAGQRFKENPLKDGPKAFLGRSENGWMNSEVFYEYVANSFIPWIEEHNIPKPVLLLVDRHNSHITYEVGKLCNEADVELYPLPPHASHVIQPCDVGFFKPLKSAWARAEHQYRQDNPGLFVTKYTFASVFRGPWEEVTRKKELVQSGFRATGIFPFTRMYAKEKLAPASVYREVEEEASDINSHAPGPSGDAAPSSSPGSSSGGQSVSLPLEKHLRYPQITRVKTGRRKGEDLPKCISSDAYLKYLKEKQEAKDQEEERKRKRKEEQGTKKKAKEDGKRKRKKKTKNMEEESAMTAEIEVNTCHACPECGGKSNFQGITLKLVKIIQS